MIMKDLTIFLLLLFADPFFCSLKAKMRKLLSAIGLFVAIFSAAIAGPREDAIQLVGMWPNEFTDSDVDGIVECAYEHE